MRRQSTKKSSMFKVQADKNVYKAFLDSVDQCETVRKHPHLLDVAFTLFSLSLMLPK